MIQGVIVRLSKMKYLSYLSLSRWRQSRGSNEPSSDSHGQPVAPRSASKMGQWTKLNESSLRVQAKSEAHRGLFTAGNEEYELTPAGFSGEGKMSSTETRDLV